MTQNFKSFVGGAESIVGKEEIAGRQNFLLFPQCFKKAFLFKIVKSQDSVARVNSFATR